MKKIFLETLFFFSFFLSLSFAQELLLNGGFERGEKGEETGLEGHWKGYGITEWQVGREEDGYKVFEGTYSAQVADFVAPEGTYGYGYLYQIVPVEGGETYSLSGWVFDNSPLGYGQIRIYWYESLDASGTHLGREKTNSTVDLPEYQFLSLEKITAPLEAQSAKVAFYIALDNPGEAVLYFDQMSFKIYSWKEEDFFLCVENSPFYPGKDLAGQPEKAKIIYNLGEEGSAFLSLKVFDLRGNCVRLLCEEEGNSLKGEVFWDGSNHQGKLLPLGVYIICLEAVIKEKRKTISQWKTVVLGKRL
jgi:hypothetical protein